jgi:hypothetical protein
VRLPEESWLLYSTQPAGWWLPLLDAPGLTADSQEAGLYPLAEARAVCERCAADWFGTGAPPVVMVPASVLAPRGALAARDPYDIGPGLYAAAARDPYDIALGTVPNARTTRTPDQETP